MKSKLFVFLLLCSTIAIAQPYKEFKWKDSTVTGTHYAVPMIPGSEIVIDGTITDASKLSIGDSNSVWLPYWWNGKFALKSDSGSGGFMPYWFGGKFWEKGDSNTTKNPITLSYAVDHFLALTDTSNLVPYTYLSALLPYYWAKADLDTADYVSYDYLTAALGYYSPLAGSSSFTTAGTIASGIWHGTAIDTLYLNGMSNIWAGYGIVLSARGKGYQVGADTSELASKDFTSNQYVPRDSLTTLRNEMNAKMDSINALRAEVVAIWAFIESLTSAPTYDTTNYYLSYSTGFDADNSGHNSTLPIKTFSRLTALGLQAGDSVFLLTDDTWYESLTISSAGTSGSPIVITSYGTGANPIISGGEVLTGWVQSDSTVWSCKASADVYNLFVDDVQQTLARSPNEDQWWNIDSANTTKTYLASAEAVADLNYWQGCRARIRSVNWSYEGPTIASSTTAGVLTLSSATTFAFPEGYKFYIEEKKELIDTVREWYCDKTTDSVYCQFPEGTNPNDLIIEGSIYPYGVIDTGHSYITINGIHCDKHYTAGIYVTKTPTGINISNNTVTNSYAQGIQFTGAATNCIIESNNVSDVNGTGIAAYAVTGAQIVSNIVQRCGLVPGKSNQPFGILAYGYGNRIAKNTVDSVGNSGIFGGTGGTIDSNKVSKYGLTAEDLGGIYVSTDSLIKIRSNIVSDGVGYTASRGGNTVTITITGIYQDYPSSLNAVLNNTIIRPGNHGLFINYGGHGDTIKGNMIYDVSSPAGVAAWERSSAISMRSSTAYPSPSENVIEDNTVFNSDTTAFMWTYTQAQGGAFLPIGTMNNNRYYNPFGQVRLFYHTVTGVASKYMDLAMWKDTTGQESTSTDDMYRAIAYGTQLDTLLVNTSDSPDDFVIGEGLYRYPADGSLAEGTVTVAGYSSLLLIADSVTVQELVLADATPGSEQLAFSGTLTPHGYDATAYFCYGTTTATYTDSIVATQSPVSGFTATTVSATETGLVDGTTYYYILRSISERGVVATAEKSAAPYTPIALASFDTVSVATGSAPPWAVTINVPAGSDSYTLMGLRLYQIAAGSKIDSIVVYSGATRVVRMDSITSHHALTAWTDAAFLFGVKGLTEAAYVCSVYAGAATRYAVITSHYNNVNQTTPTGATTITASGNVNIGATLSNDVGHVVANFVEEDSPNVSYPLGPSSGNTSVVIMPWAISTRKTAMGYRTAETSGAVNLWTNYSMKSLLTVVLNHE